jgi:pimeloyl-ACP methyl ester carboxylesterase
MSQLTAARVAAGDRHPKPLLLMHGIYGRGRNLQAVARALVAARPEYECWLLDLPYHGDSGASTHGATVAGLAAEVLDWQRALGLQPTAILGHSYGGKVALAMLPALADRPLQVWIIDSTPESKPPSGSAWNMLEVIRRLPPMFQTREEAVAAIVAGGFPHGVAQWMSTNLVRRDGVFVWRLDFDIMEALLHDFFDTDLWPGVEAPAPGHELHFLKASESSAISDAAVDRLEAATSRRQVFLHHRAGGHWIHAESPAVVAELLIEHLP